MNYTWQYIGLKPKHCGGFPACLAVQRRRGVRGSSVQPGGGEAPQAGDEIQRVPAALGVPPPAPRDGSQDQHGGYRQQSWAQNPTPGSGHVTGRSFTAGLAHLGTQCFIILLAVAQARTWFGAEGEPRLKDSYTTDDTLVCTETAVQHFEEFLAEAKVLFCFLLFCFLY